MDILQSSAISFQKLFHKEYIIKAGHRQKLLEASFYFQAEHFHHLAGLQKLTDLSHISRIKNKTLLFKNILSGELTYNEISQSKEIANVDNRLAYFSRINNLIDNLTKGDIIIKFDKRKAFTAINADLLLYENYNEKYVHLFFELKRDKLFIPCSFFQRDDNKYIIKQETYKILEVAIVDHL